MDFKGAHKKQIIKYSGGTFYEKVDDIVVEKALQIVLKQNQKIHPLLITMRTPVDDFDMISGYLFCEKIIFSASDIINIRFFPGNLDNTENIDKIVVDLKKNVDLSHIHDSYVSFSSCGLCGKSDLTLFAPERLSHIKPKIKGQLISKLIKNFNNNQNIFLTTGGIHAAAFYNLEGKLMTLKEDIGRHNALDKIIGYSLKKGQLPGSNYILLLSSRISYEMVAKCISAGVSVICGMGPASSLSIELGEEAGITIIGFARHTGFNIYCGFDRID